VENSQIERRLLVCQNYTFCKQGSAKVLATFKTFDIPNITVEKSGCLGKCGNGPMILVLPEEVCYGHVEPQNISVIMENICLVDSRLKKYWIMS
jgi:(2Fe-2S) ferredoxin